MRTSICLSLLFLVNAPYAHAEPPAGLLFEEHFEDDALAKREWYDLSKLRIAKDGAAGKGCIEYEWVDKKSPTVGSSGMRRMFEPTDEIFLRPRHPYTQGLIASIPVIDEAVASQTRPLRGLLRRMCAPIGQRRPASSSR